MLFRSEITCDGRRIPAGSIVQAVAVSVAAVFILLAVVIMLATTQSADCKSLIFEAVSALGTVGLSLGVTDKLDEVGKIIIMAAMFIGRIGPLTFFLMLSDREKAGSPGFPPVKIPMG